MFWNVTFIYNAFIRSTEWVVKNYPGSLLPGYPTGTRRVPGYPRQPYTRAFNEFLYEFFRIFLISEKEFSIYD